MRTRNIPSLWIYLTQKEKGWNCCSPVLSITLLCVPRIWLMHRDTTFQNAKKILKHSIVFSHWKCDKIVLFWSVTIIAGGGGGEGVCKNHNIQKNFFLTYEQIITKLSMKATVFSSDYPTFPMQTMNKKINLDIIHTLFYISENKVGNLPGKWVLEQWDCWGKKMVSCS